MRLGRRRWRGLLRSIRFERFEVRAWLKQLLAGTRKFKRDLINRSDIAALSKLASEVMEIPMMHEVEAAEPSETKLNI
jgi:hypothetical protein